MSVASDPQQQGRVLAEDTEKCCLCSRRLRDRQITRLDAELIRRMTAGTRFAIACEDDEIEARSVQDDRDANGRPSVGRRALPG